MGSIDFARARRHLMRRDPVLGAVIKRVGPCGLGASHRTDTFPSLVEAIVWQQLSGKAADTIYRRVLATFDATSCPEPHLWVAMSAERLRAAGLSRGKIAFIKDLAAQVHDGRLHLEAFDALEDEAVIAELTRVKGIGRWTAEMFLMFRLQRPDVFPIGDLGVVRAIERLYRLRKPPTPARLLKIGEPWRPYRSVASWYLWHSGTGQPLATE